MNALIFLTLLCLGMASAAPKADHSVEAQSDLWTVEDTVSHAALEESPETPEKDNQEQSEEEESLGTATNASDYITLQMKIFPSRRIFDMIKGVTRKSVLKKAAKGFGKKVLGELIKPQNVGDIVYGIGKQVLGGKHTQESLTTPAVETIEEF